MQTLGLITIRVRKFLLDFTFFQWIVLTNKIHLADSTRIFVCCWRHSIPVTSHHFFLCSYFGNVMPDCYKTLERFAIAKVKNGGVREFIYAIFQDDGTRTNSSEIPSHQTPLIKFLSQLDKPFSRCYGKCIWWHPQDAKFRFVAMPPKLIDRFWWNSGERLLAAGSLMRSLTWTTILKNGETVEKKSIGAASFEPSLTIFSFLVWPDWTKYVVREILAEMILKFKSLAI